MDFAETVVLVIGSLIILFTLWFFFGQRDVGQRDVGQRDVGQRDLGQRDELPPARTENAEPFACPMHPWITSRDTMATCSICGLKLHDIHTSHQ